MNFYFYKNITLFAVFILFSLSCGQNSGRRDNGSSGNSLISATHIKIENAPGGVGSEITTANLTNGAPIILYAIARDASGNFIASASVSWSESSTLGHFSQLTGSSTIFTPNNDEGSTVISTIHPTLINDSTGALNITYNVESISGLTLWLRAESLLNTAADDDDILFWHDVNGSGRSVASLAPGQEPNFKTNIINSWPTVRFTPGNSEGLESSFMISDIITNSAYTYFIIFNSAAINTDDSDPRNNNALIIDNGGNFGATLRSGAPLIQAYNQSGTDDVSTKNISTATTFLFTARLDTGNLHTQLNGDSDTTTVSGVNTDITNVLNIGGGYAPAGFYDGDISEIIVFNSALNTTDRQTVHSYLCTKYSINSGNCP